MNKYIFPVVALIIAVASFVVAISSDKTVFGGLVHLSQENFVSGLKAGTTSQEVINSAGDIVGPIDGTEARLSSTLAVTGASTLTGAAGLSSTLTVAGETRLHGLIEGGDVTTDATTTAHTMLAANICDSSVIIEVPSVDDGYALTLPTTTTLAADCLTTTGDRHKIFLWNATTTAAGFSTTTITANLGIEILCDFISGDDCTIITAGEKAILEFTRISTATTTVEIRHLVNKDGE